MIAHADFFQPDPETALRHVPVSIRALDVALMADIWEKGLVQAMAVFSAHLEFKGHNVVIKDTGRLWESF